MTAASNKHFLANRRRLPPGNRNRATATTYGLYTKWAEKAKEPPIGSRVCARSSLASPGSAEDVNERRKAVSKGIRRRTRTITGEQKTGGTDGGTSASDRPTAIQLFSFFQFNCTIWPPFYAPPGPDGPRMRNPRARALARKSDRARLKTGISSLSPWDAPWTKSRGNGYL